MHGIFSSCGTQASHPAGLSSCGEQVLDHAGFSNFGSWALEHRLSIVTHGLSCSAACGMFPDHGSNPCLQHWQVDSYTDLPGKPQSKFFVHVLNSTRNTLFPSHLLFESHLCLKAQWKNLISSGKLKPF